MFENPCVFPQNWSCSLPPIPLTGTHSGLNSCSLWAEWTTRMPRACLCYPSQCLGSSPHISSFSACFSTSVVTQEHNILYREIEFGKSMGETWGFFLVGLFFWSSSSWLSIRKPSFYIFPAFLVLKVHAPEDSTQPRPGYLSSLVLVIDSEGGCVTQAKTKCHSQGFCQNS